MVICENSCPNECEGTVYVWGPYPGKRKGKNRPHDGYNRRRFCQSCADEVFNNEDMVYMVQSGEYGLWILSPEQYKSMEEQIDQQDKASSGKGVQEIVG